MTSNENITGPLCGELTGHRWILVTKARAFMFSLICTWTNGSVNNRNAGDLRCHHAHYDIPVITNSFDILSISWEIGLGCEPRNLVAYKPTLVQVMAWYYQATIYYLSQCWPRSMPPYEVTRPYWVKDVSQIGHHQTTSKDHLCPLPSECTVFSL